MLIKTNSGDPFKTEHAAKIHAGRLKLQDFKVVPVPGEEGAEPLGYALETEEKSEPAQESAPAVKKHRVTKPWQPASLLHIPEDLKNPDYVYRFCVNEESRPGNIRKKLAEGWEIDKTLLKEMKKRGLLHAPTLDDGQSLDDTLTIREMVVMKMDKETAKSRNQYFERRASDAADSAKSKYKSDAKALGIETYGDVTETQEA